MIRILFFKAKKSLRNKIILLACSVALVTSLFIVTATYLRITEIILDTAMEGLAGETRLMSLRFQSAYDEMQNDVAVVSYTPPIEGLIRSTRNNDIDPLDNSTTELWRQRLGTIFSSVMASRPHYTQMRYIGVANNGRELVRVNRTEEGLKFIPEKELQEKGGEPYFREALKTKEDDVYFSEVTYNREFGETDSTLIPTIRSITPIYDETGEIFGLVVINANYPQLLTHIFESIAPNKNAFVLNHVGDYMEYHPDTQSVSFEMHSDYQKQPPDFVRSVQKSTEDEMAFIGKKDVAYFVRLTTDPENPESFLGAVLRIPKSELLQDAYTLRTRNILLSTVLVAICLIITAMVARIFTRPLQKMTESIQQAETLPNLPVHQADEIGDLARAFQDLTLRISKSEAKVRAVLDNVADGIITFNDKGIIDSCNPACEHLFGLPYNAMEGKHISHFITAYEQQKGAKASFESGNQETEGMRTDGSRFAMDLSTSEAMIDNTRLFTAIVRDITERKQMDILKDEFISTVNHELRTPLTAIHGALGLLKASRSAGKLDAKGQRLLELSHYNCERLTQLINDILDIEKMAAGKMQHRIERVEICSLVKEIADKHQEFAEQSGITFDLQLKLKEAYCLVDTSRFHQALVNLLSNAIKFSPEGEKVVIKVAEKGNSDVKISVIDRGPGVPPAFYDKIFGKFAQADSSSTRAKGGTGLGLNITKSIIEAFNGMVDFTSKEGKGSEFYFILPLADKPAKKG